MIMDYSEMLALFGIYSKLTYSLLIQCLRVLFVAKISI